jgi:hypothetical protein
MMVGVGAKVRVPARGALVPGERDDEPALHLHGVVV